MLTSLILLVVGQSSLLTKYVDKAASIVDATKSGSVVIKIETQYNGKNSVSTTSLDFQKGKSLLVRIKEPVQGELDATDRSYYITGSTMVAYDHRWAESLSRKNLFAKWSLLDKANASIGDLGEPTTCMLSGETLTNVLARFANVGKWSSKATNFGTILSAANATNHSAVGISVDKSGRLLEISLSQKDSFTRWTYSYNPFRAVSLVIPPKTRLVKQFTARPAPPSFKDSNAKTLYYESVKAYEALRTYQLKVQEISGTSSLWVSGRNMRGEDSAKTWCYRSGSCAVVDRSTKKFYSGKVQSADLIDALGNLKLSIASWQRWALLSRNPILSMIDSSFSIRSAGSLQINGVEMSILEASSSKWTGLLQIDKATKLVSSWTVKSYDRSGKLVSQSVQNLKYSGIGNTIPDTVFKLGVPNGYKSASLASLKKP